MKVKILFFIFLFPSIVFAESTENLVFRGVEYTKLSNKVSLDYTRLDNYESYTSEFELKMDINKEIFRSITSIDDPHLEDIYVKADKNKDGLLSWKEIEKFQSWLYAHFKYKVNDVVLRPDEFLKNNGGDCDDWSEVTAGLMYFYGYEPYIARFGRTKIIGHALCLVKVNTNEISPYYMWYEIEDWSIPDGYYVPIDYDRVGGLSAIDRRWKISNLYDPVTMYKLQQ